MNALNVHKSFRAGPAIYKFSREANYWLEFVSRGRKFDKIIWEEFKQMFYEKFFNKTTKDNMVAEFMNLKMEDITLAYYKV